MKYPSWSRKPHIRKRHVVLTVRGWVVQETGELLVSTVQLPKSIQTYFNLVSPPTIDNDSVNMTYLGTSIALDFADLRKFIDDPDSFMTMPMPDPTTVSFTGTQVIAGFTGSVSTTKNGARIYARAALTIWSGFISGTEAKLTTTSDFGDFDGGIQVAVDGGAFIDAPRVGQVYTLFTGLAHATRFVEVRYADGLGDAPYVSTSGGVISVTGQPPTVQTLTNKIEAGADSALGIFSGAITSNAANYTPVLQAPKGVVYGSNIGSVKIKGAFTKLVVTLNGARKVGVSKNGGLATYYTIADEGGLGFPTRALVIPCDGTVATYNVWDNGNERPTGGAFCVAGDSAFLDIGVRRRLDQYGDSVTYGSGPGAMSCDTETMRVAAALGFVGSTNGISGLTIGAAKTLLDNVLPLRTVGPNDVAILAIGGNSASGGIDSTEQVDYSALIDKLLAKGYGKVLCRAILPVPDSGSQAAAAAANVTLKSIVDGKANVKVIWVDTSSWVGYETQDGVHPTAAGYVTIAGHAIPAYIALNL